MKISKIQFIILSLTACLAVATLHSNSSYAFTNGRLIDNAVFDNKNSMSELNIQNFINAFPKSCLSPQNYPGGLSPVTFKEPSSYYDYSGNDVSPARIIWKASQLYGLNPQVILATLEKEQNLVTGNAGCAVWKYNSAMGYNCPDGSENSLRNYPNIGVSNTCVAKEINVTFSRQVNHSGWQFMFDRQRAEGNIYWSEPSEPNPSVNHNTVYVGRMTEGFRKTSAFDSGRQYDGFTSIDGTPIYLQNGATASLYNFTPHFNNFASIFTNWFGTTYAYIYGGISYADVYDPDYYINTYPDIRSSFQGNPLAAFDHFVRYGIKEGRQAKADFDVNSYRNRYADLRWIFGASLEQYYHHFISNGKREGRYAVGSVPLTPVTTYGGIDYSSVYNFSVYLSQNSDMQNRYANDDTGALMHFVNYGMDEGRSASLNYSVDSYRNRYFDLRKNFGSNLKLYYMHFVRFGNSEGRVGMGDFYGGTSVSSGLDYASAYSFNDYRRTNSDIKNTFNLDDNKALQHFIEYGMTEGRIASQDFNVTSYKQRYLDLQQAYGNDLRLYYIHYIKYGKNEGRIGN